MANISVRRESEDSAAPVVSSWDPLRLMRGMLTWDPFRSVDPFREMAPLLRDDAYAFAPAFEVKETKDGYLFRADVPGVKEADLEVTLTGTRLTINGKREAEKKEERERYYAYERTFGSFTRAFTLPEGIDAASVRAELKEGVLTVTVAKLPEAQPKRIEVKSKA